MCQAVEEILNPYAPLYKTLQNSNDTNLSHSVVNGNFENNKVSWINKLTSRTADRIINSDLKWRENLKIGDYIDAVCKYKIPQGTCNKTVTAWQPAKVVF
jgi:hypothetical protein